MNGEAIFVRDGARYLANPIADGPWAVGSLHGGAPAALLAHLLTPGTDPAAGLRLARLTCEFVRPVPRGPLAVRVEDLRGGRRVTLRELTIEDSDGVVVTRARALLLASSQLAAGDDEPPPFPGPEAGEPSDWRGARPMFATHAMDIRFVEGRFREAGPATAWFRLRQPVLAGEPGLPAERVAAAADFGNGISSVLSWEEHVFINPDLTIYLERDPVDEWVALRSRMRVHTGSVAIAESTLWDRRGRIGHATQSLLVARNSPRETGDRVGATSGGTP